VGDAHVGSVSLLGRHLDGPPREETFAFLADVLTEVAALFPGPLIHVGGDEVRSTVWTNSPVAQR